MTGRSGHGVRISPRQAQILDALCAGHGNRRIAADLGISEDTVKTQRRRLFRALGVDDRTQAVALVAAGAVRITVTEARSP